ncbi:MAG TPA: hypothetical protein P5523_09740 [Bacteroidales bacterium]|jgi:uncharacterized HAD superfamily protein|nr:hypothetical protein [Bacteroidales bacterium]
MIIDNDRIKKFKIRFLLAITVIVIIGFIIDREPFLKKSGETNEKATIEYLKKFTEGDITKIVILTQGNYSKFQAVCTYIIRDEKLVKEFKNIVLRQSSVIIKKAWGQTGRETHITLYNKENEKYSFILNSDPYSGNRPINEIEISFFLKSSFDVSENWLPDPEKAIDKNINNYRPASSNLQNYELYYFLKKNIIDFTEENRPNTAGISGKCYITKEFKK